MKDYYKILGVNLDSDKDEIKSRFKTLARKYHPDLNPGDKNAEESFKEVNEAYSVLSNEDSRKKYDQKLNGFKSPNNEPKKQNNTKSSTKQNIDFSDIDKSFESFFGFNPKTKNTTNNAKRKNNMDTSSIFENYFGNFKK